MIYEGAKVQFVPSFNAKEKFFNRKEDYITGTIYMVNWEHKTFFVRYKAGDTIQTEAFKFFDIGKSVKILGR